MRLRRRLPVVWPAHNHILWLCWDHLWSLAAAFYWLCLELFDLVAILPSVPEISKSWKPFWKQCWHLNVFSVEFTGSTGCTTHSCTCPCILPCNPPQSFPQPTAHFEREKIRFNNEKSEFKPQILCRCPRCTLPHWPYGNPSPGTHMYKELISLEIISPRCSLDHCMVALASRNLVKAFDTSVKALRALHTSVKILALRAWFDPEVQDLRACCNHSQALVFWQGHGSVATR